MELIGAVLVLVALGFGPPSVHPAESKPAWQIEWEKVLAAAKKEGQVAVYISGYEEVLPEFQKEYPDIKLTFGYRPRLPTGATPCHGAPRREVSRRRFQFTAAVTTYGQLHAAKVLDPIKPALILPEVTDTSKWYQKKHHYTDPEGQYVFSYVGSGDLWLGAATTPS